MKGNDNKMLAITDGTLGSNIVKVDEDPEQEKRRSNILKSREIRKRSAKGPRAESRGKGSVFERLSKEPKKTKQPTSSTKAPKKTKNLLLLPLLALDPTDNEPIPAQQPWALWLQKVTEMPAHGALM